MANYQISNEIRKKYPIKTKEWETLLKMADDPRYHGCYTCSSFREIEKDHFVDVRKLDDNDDSSDTSNSIPWDTEAAWVYCSLEPEIETPLKINCHAWEYSGKKKVK